ncbi:MAG: TonB-dependent receptor plug domain-containing protein [Gemmatimonadales bacterium]
MRAMGKPVQLAVILAVCAPRVAVAQQDTATLEPVVVTATRLPVAVANVAASVTVLSGDALRLQGVRRLTDALRGVAGIAIVETGAFGGLTSLFLRGGENDFTKVLVDGIPLNQPGGGLDLADLTTDQVERIEIVRGPASVLYGSDAMTGVIQIFTRAGAGPPRIGAELRGGTYGTTDAALELSGAGAGGRLTYAARISRFASQGLYPHNNDYRNTVFSGRAGYVPDAATRVALVYRLGDDVYHIPTNPQGQPADSNAFSSERGPALSLSVQRTFGALDAQITGTWREARLAFSDEPDSPGEDGSFHSRDYVRRAGGGLQIAWNANPRMTLLAGVEYEDERQHGRSEFAASFGTFPDSIAVRRWNWGYYGQAIVGRAGPLTVTLGARLENNSQFGDHVTTRGGVSWAVADRTRIRVAAGTGFKEPTFFENFARGFATGNPALDPERSRSWELGIEHQVVAERVIVSLTYFDQRFRDLVEFTLTPPPGEPNYFNVAGASADGVEAEVHARPGRGLELTGRYTYLATRVEEPGPDGGADALFVEGEPLLRRPAHTVAVSLSGAAGRRAHVTLGARWVGRRDDLDFSRPAGARRVTLSPHTRAHLAVQYELTRALALTARVDNLFDDRAAEIAGFRPRGRTILVGGRATLAP